MASKPKKMDIVVKKIAEAVKKSFGDGAKEPITVQGPPVNYEIGPVRICFGGEVIEEIDPKDLV